MGDFQGHPFRGNQYEAGQKYHQAVPEITHLPPALIRKQHDDREVSRVTDEVARSIEQSAKRGTLPPVDVTVFASGEVIVSGGHHRLAAAKQLGFVLPVNVQAVNARGEKINELIQASRQAGGVPEGVTFSRGDYKVREDKGQYKNTSGMRAEEQRARASDRAEMADWIKRGYPQADASDELKRRERARRDR